MIPPTIPTSFVPHSSGATSHRLRSDLSNVFGLFAYFVLGGVVVLAISIFFYGRILTDVNNTKLAELAKARETIDLKTVEDFGRLRDRLEFGATLLNGHTAFSGFFSLLDTLIPSTVRFSSLRLFMNDEKGVKVEGTGVAKSFNALAAASASFATDGRVKDAVFSNIVVNSRDNSVSFALTATLDKKTIAFSGIAPVASTAPIVSEKISSTTPTL